MTAAEQLQQEFYERKLGVSQTFKHYEKVKTIAIGTKIE